MSSFAQLQKIKANQAPVKPFSKENAKRKQARLRKKPTTTKVTQTVSILLLIFTLPTEVVDLIFFDKEKYQDNWYAPYAQKKNIKSFLQLMFVNKQMYQIITGICERFVSKFDLSILRSQNQESITKLYYEMRTYETDTQFPDGLVISKSKCESCLEDNVLVKQTKHVISLYYRRAYHYSPKSCLTRCRKYYCINRSCEFFAETVVIDNFNEQQSDEFYNEFDFEVSRNVPVCVGEGFSGVLGCGRDLVRENKLTDKMKCTREFSVFTKFPDYAHCEGDYDSLRKHACKTCRKNSWSEYMYSSDDEWGY